MSVEFLESALRFTVQGKIQDVSMDSPSVVNLEEKIKNLVVSLQENNFDWKANNNLLVFEAVSASMLMLKKIKKYKKLSIEEKKDICFGMVEKLIENQIKKLDITPEMKQLAQVGVDTIIEPIIELSILTMLQKTKFLNKLFPCLK